MMAKFKFLSILIIVLLPLLIFTGCSYSNEYINSFKQYINDQENNIGSGEIEQKDNLKNVIESKGSKNSNENLVAICIPYSTDDSTILEYLGFDYQQDTFFIATIFDYNNSSVFVLLTFTLESNNCFYSSSYESSGVELFSGTGQVSRNRIMTLAYLYFDDYDGSYSYKFNMQELTLTIIQDTINIYDSYLETYNINFIEDYFS